MIKKNLVANQSFFDEQYDNLMLDMFDCEY